MGGSHRGRERVLALLLSMSQMEERVKAGGFRILEAKDLNRM